MISFCFCCNYVRVGHIGMQIFNFVILSVITTPHNVLTSCSSKAYLPNVSLNVREVE